MKKCMLYGVVLLGLILGLNPVAVHAQEDPCLWLEEVDGEKALDWVKAKNATTIKTLKQYSRGP